MSGIQDGSNIKELLKKFVQNECNAQEIERLISYFKEVQGIGELPTLEEVRQLLDEDTATSQQMTKLRSEQVLGKAKQREKVMASRRQLWKYASVAAVFIGVLTLGYFYLQGFFGTDTEQLLVPPNEAITLQLEDGTLRVLNEDATEQIMDVQGDVVANQEQSQLDYTGAGSTEGLVYNTLKVPYGKRFDVVLSDGTTVYLNSGTELKYPVSFLTKGTREVFVEGEAYFDVNPDSERPFIVNAEALNVEVLGTEFNVLAYPEDGMTDVVLVEGRVGLYADETKSEKTTVLTPGQKGSFDKSEENVFTERVNTTVYTAWRTGELVYRNLPFKNIARKLERHYNINIRLHNEELGEEPFSASFTNKTLEEVLSYFDELYGIEYKIENNQVLIE